MTQLSLASNQPEARKFSRDDEVRPGTPELEVFRPRAPALSRSWGLISIVVAHRNADVARDHHRAIDSKWRYDEGVAQKRDGIPRFWLERKTLNL